MVRSPTLDRRMLEFSSFFHGGGLFVRRVEENKEHIVREDIELTKGRKVVLSGIARGVPEAESRAGAVGAGDRS